MENLPYWWVGRIRTMIKDILPKEINSPTVIPTKNNNNNKKKSNAIFYKTNKLLKVTWGAQKPKATVRRKNRTMLYNHGNKNIKVLVCAHTHKTDMYTNGIGYKTEIKLCN